MHATYACNAVIVYFTIYVLLSVAEIAINLEDSMDSAASIAVAYKLFGTPSDTLKASITVYALSPALSQALKPRHWLGSCSYMQEL